jgi:hypothetical protein
MAQGDDESLMTTVHKNVMLKLTDHLMQQLMQTSGGASVNAKDMGVSAQGSSQYAFLPKDPKVTQMWVPAGATQSIQTPTA